MIAPVIVGVLAAFLVTLPPWFQGQLPGVFLPIMVPGVAALAVMLQRFVLDHSQGSRTYDGVADLIIHIHSPSNPDTALRWAVRGLNSLLLAVCGGVAGPEGAAVEFGQALALGARPRSARWFEQSRRTDAATALAAGVSAAFGAPFAGYLLPTELGLGGRSIPIALGALAAFVMGRVLRGALGVNLPDFSGAAAGAGFVDPRAWLGAVIVGITAGMVCAGLVRFFRYTQDSLLDLFQTRAWTRTLCAGVLLFLLVLAYRMAHVPAAGLFEQALWARHSTPESVMLFSAGVLSLSIVLAGFGTVGVFWPALVLGGLFGIALSGAALSWLGAPTAAMGLVGGAAFWGALLGAPVSGAVLIFELTHNIYVLPPCLAAAAIAHWVRGRLRTPTLIQSDLEARGLGLLKGRSVEVLSAISVRDAMVVDHEIVHEHEPISEIYPRLLKSHYPFLPVVNSSSLYIGLLTVDLIQEAWRSQSDHSNSPLAKLLEAKDLLYRSGVKGPTIQVRERLSSTAGLFDVVPCVPVLSEEGRILGLLFVHNVRLAYDRAMLKRDSVTFWSAPR